MLELIHCFCFYIFFFINLPIKIKIDMSINNDTYYTVITPWLFLVIVCVTMSLIILPIRWSWRCVTSNYLLRTLWDWCFHKCFQCFLSMFHCNILCTCFWIFCWIGLRRCCFEVHFVIEIRICNTLVLCLFYLFCYFVGYVKRILVDHYGIQEPNTCPFEAFLGLGFVRFYW